MRMNTPVALLFAVAMVVPVCPARAQQPSGPAPKRVYVTFASRSVKDEPLLMSFADLFEVALGSLNSYTLLQRAELSRILIEARNEDALSMKDLNTSTKDRLERLERADGVIFGEVIDDVASGEVRITAALETFDGVIHWKVDESMRRALINDLSSRKMVVERLVAKLGGDPRPPLRWRFGATLFTSVGPRDTTPLFGAHQALGSAVALGFPLGDVWEMNLEGCCAVWREALDSGQTGSAAERRFLRDSFFSVTAGRGVRLGARGRAIPVAGGGLAVLQTRRYSYSAAGATVQTRREDLSRVVPVGTAGVDLRVELARSIYVLASYRLHLLAGRTDIDAPRSRFQHRPGIGVQWTFGDRP
jgi:hypothetical protein